MKIAICDDQTCYIEETRILLEQWGTIHTIPLTIFSYSNGDAFTFFAVMDAFYQQYQSKKETFFARTETGSYNIPLANTEFLEAQNKRVTVHLENGSCLLIKELFSDCAAVFPPEKGFFQCHRSYIVNMNDIAQFTKTKLITKSGITIPISRNHYPVLK